MKKGLILVFVLLLFQIATATGQQIHPESVEFSFSSIEQGKRTTNLVANKTARIIGFEKIISSESVIAIKVGIATNNTGKFSAIVSGSLPGGSDPTLSRWSLFEGLKIIASEQSTPKVFIFHSSKLGFSSNFGMISISIEFNVINGGIGILDAQIRLEFEIGKYVRGHESPLLFEKNQSVSLIQLPFAKATFEGSIFLFSKFVDFYVQPPTFPNSSKFKLEITLDQYAEDSGGFTVVPYLPSLKTADQTIRELNLTTFIWNSVTLNQEIQISLEGRNSPANVSLHRIQLTAVEETQGFLDKLLIVKGNSPIFGLFVVAIVWGSYLGITRKRISLGTMRMNR